MMTRPREAVLTLTDGWDLNELDESQEDQLLASPFVFMAFVSEACGWWDGESVYHQSVTLQDEAYAQFAYVVCDVHDIIRLMTILLGWDTKNELVQLVPSANMYSEHTCMCLLECFLHVCNIFF